MAGFFGPPDPRWCDHAAVSLRGGDPIQEQGITRRAVGVTEPVTGRIDPMSFAKGLLCHPALIRERSRLVAEEATYATNRKNLIAGGNSRTWFVHGWSPGTET